MSASPASPERATPLSASVSDAPASEHALPALPAWLPPLFYLLLACAFLWRSLFAGDVFLPAGLLGHLAPWASTAHTDTLPPWNPLRWDGIAQFYPWRHFAAETLRSGLLPLWNPYQFCGTPFIANSQSAVFYPGNFLFYLLPTARAFGWSAALHLTLCGWFTYLLLRTLRCSSWAALLGGCVFAYSAWQVAWLQLPTFLATSCWFPLLLRQAYLLFAPPTDSRQRRSPFPLLALTVGLMLLAGHLQIAFYGLLAGILWTVALAATRWRESGRNVALRGFALGAGALALGLMLVAPQLLPALELSRVSHRAGNPTSEGYAAYVEYGLPAANLASLTLPAFFGGDTDAANPYWGFYVKPLGDGQAVAIRHNAAETALYVGIAPLVLSGLALLRLRRNALNRRVVFFGGLALFALLLALGTPLNRLFYFGIPGFGQSGSPARVLVLWALAWAGLSAFGLDALAQSVPTLREIGILLGGLAFVLAIGLSLAASALGAKLPGMAAVPTLGDVFAHLTLNWIALAVFAGASGILLLKAVRAPIARSKSGPGPLPLFAPLAVVLVVADLFAAGINANPTAAPGQVYPVTPGIALLQSRIGHERIAPLNRRWSLYQPPPAVLPPNAGMVYGLRDTQGYDSLFTASYKAFAGRLALPDAAGLQDASPPEVGNMVFIQNAGAIETDTGQNLPLLGVMSVTYAIGLPASASAPSGAGLPEAAPIYNDEMAIYTVSGGAERATLDALSKARRALAHLVWREDGPTRVAFDVDSSGEARLYLNDPYYPGWNATMDGREARIFYPPVGLPTFRRMVIVPGGRHTVAFRYEPASFRVGLYLACLAACLLSLCVGFDMARQRRLPRREM